ncbi:hypothetical protein [Mucilaginibacter sp. 3215]
MKTHKNSPSMKAIRIHEFGSLEQVLKLEEIESPANPRRNSRVLSR